MACPVPPTGVGFLSGMLDHIDCQAQTLGANGYAAIASPGSSVSLVLTALLTIFIAVFGIRMLLGQMPDIGELAIAAVKVGIVLTLATSWPAYRTIAYDTVLRGPAELVSAIGGASELPGASGGLIARLQAVDDAIVAFTTIGSGRDELIAMPRDGAAPVSDNIAFGIARVAYLGSAIATLGIARLIGGVLLALAPLFAALLLFDATRGLFLGWLRMLVASALASFAVTIVLAIELSLLEPWLESVLAQRAARLMTPGAPLELLVMTLAFATIAFAAIGFAVRVASTVAGPGWIATTNRWLRTTGDRTAAGSFTMPDIERQAREERSRAAIVADAVASAQRREAGTLSVANRTPGVIAGLRGSGETPPSTAIGFTPVGQNYRRTSTRVSAAGARRSARA